MLLTAQMTPEGRLSVAVFNMAAVDWRRLVRHKAWKKAPSARCNFTELRQFFHSERAQLLSSFCEELTPERMLHLLEEELEEAMAEEEKKRAADR